MSVLFRYSDDSRRQGITADQDERPSITRCIEDEVRILRCQAASGDLSATSNQWEKTNNKKDKKRQGGRLVSAVSAGICWRWNRRISLDGYYLSCLVSDSDYGFQGVEWSRILDTLTASCKLQAEEKKGKKKTNQ